MEQTECNICGADMDLGQNVIENELIECSDCGAEFEVTGVNPVRLEMAPQEEEDWGE